MTAQVNAGQVRREADCELVHWADAVRGTVDFRTVISRDLTGTAEMSSGIAYLLPDQHLSEHRHDTTEIYFIADGSGQMSLDGEHHRVSAGDTVFIPRNCSHSLSNAGTGVLRWFYVFNVDSFDDVNYRYPTGTD